MAGIGLLFLVLAVVGFRAGGKDKTILLEELQACKGDLAGCGQDLESEKALHEDCAAALEARTKDLVKSTSELAACLSRLVALENIHPTPVATSTGVASDTVGGVPPGLLGQLKEALDGKGVPVEIDEKKWTLELNEKFLFGLGSSELSEDREAGALAVGSAVVQMLRTKGNAEKIGTVEVIGHADSTGDPEFNVSLSRQRANALVDLWRRELLAGADDRCANAKIFAIGVSSFRPVVLEDASRDECQNGLDDPETSQDESAGCARNRRIEIRIVPKPPARKDVAGCD